MSRSAASSPKQVPHQEWLHSDFKATESCQSCHMPVVTQPTRIASVLGEPRDAVSRHDFRGANFFMLSIFNRFRADLAVVAQPAELDNAILLALSDMAAAYTLSAVDAERALPRLQQAVASLRELGDETIRYTGERCHARLRARRGDIVEHLLRLPLEWRVVELRPVRSDRQLARDEYQAARADRVTIMAAGRGHAGRLRIIDFTSHSLYPRFE